MNGEVSVHNQAAVAIQAELHSKVATARVIRSSWTGCLDRLKQVQKTYWLDLRLTPRLHDIRAGYPDRWGPHRFERLGDAFIVPPGERLYVRGEATGQENKNFTQTSIVCEIDADLVNEWFDGDLVWTDERLKAGLDIPDRSIRELLMRLTRETVYPGFASEKILELVACHLAIELGRFFAASGDAALGGGLAAWRLKLIDKRVKELGKPPTLSELADLCNLSVRQLSRGFQISSGYSIGRYVELNRIENAKRLLIKGEPVKQVAALVGYSSPSSFSEAFRRETGISPTRYQQRA